ncbi:hypothetical protein GCM10009795_057990 [Nocardioides hankookensis]|nr:hypothetical protein P243_1081 [Klebsiella pneumoniae subsp. pneumoniae 1158]
MVGSGYLDILRQQMMCETLRHLFAIMDRFMATTRTVRQFFHILRQT